MISFFMAQQAQERGFRAEGHSRGYFQTFHANATGTEVANDQLSPLQTHIALLFK